MAKIMLTKVKPLTADTYWSGQNFWLFGGVHFLEVWLKFSIFKLFTFFFALSRYVDIFLQKG